MRIVLRLVGIRLQVNRRRLWPRSEIAESPAETRRLALGLVRYYYHSLGSKALYSSSLVRLA